jgi:hypothetical protein
MLPRRRAQRRVWRQARQRRSDLHGPRGRDDRLRDAGANRLPPRQGLLRELGRGRVFVPHEEGRGR